MSIRRPGALAALAARSADGSANAVSCPECDLPAEVTDRFTLDSTDGPVDHVAVACAAGHHSRMAVDRFSAEAQEQLAELDSAGAERDRLDRRVSCGD